MLGATIYMMCATASFAGAFLLVRAWHDSSSRLLFWSALCFAVLTVNNVLLVADKLMLPSVDLTGVRMGTELFALLLLLFGLIWEEQ